MTASPDLEALVAAHLGDPHSQWSIGTFGAIAEFMRDADEAVSGSITPMTKSVVTSRGAIRFDWLAGVRAVASESATTRSWNHRVALCLPADACEMSRRTALTELGPDTAAIREQDRDAILFDLGLAALQVDVCVRTGDDELITRLRTGVGRPIFDHDNPAMAAILAAGPHRIFGCRFARIEVYQPIPPAHGQSPEGPHTHVLPKLLRSGLTHAATENIPDGFVPCAHIYPAHPIKDAYGRSTPFNASRHECFERTLRTFGDADIVDLKDRILAAMQAGAAPGSIVLPQSRYARTAMRVTIRQAQAAGLKSPALSLWVAAHDRVRDEELESDGIHTGS